MAPSLPALNCPADIIASRLLLNGRIVMPDAEALTDLFEQIYQDHSFEIYTGCVLLLTVILIRLFLPSLNTPYRFKMPAASPHTVSTARPPSLWSPSSPSSLPWNKVIQTPNLFEQIKLKSTLRLLIPRLRNAQKKDTALSIASRREMADLLSQSREASARIRVENIIHADITVELMEILELYAELLLARAGLLDVRDKNLKEGLNAPDENTGLEEAAASIIYAAPRLPRDVRELGLIRSMLIDRFGKEFAVRANDNVDNCVPVRVVDKLKVDPPSEKLVTAYLTEIAKAYGVDWPKGQKELEDLENQMDEDDDGDDDGGAKEPPLLAEGAAAPSTPARKAELNLGPLPPKGQPNAEGSKSPVSVAPPGPRSDNPSPNVRLPGGGQVKAPTKKVESKGAVGGAVPSVDDLAKRFQALKR